MVHGPNACGIAEGGFHEPMDVRKRLAREKSLPPHLNPLPRGEEDHLAALGR